MILYNIQRGPRGFLIAKFDDDFNVAAVYNVNPTFCDCPAGVRPSCRHRKMLPKMLAKVDTGEFYCYETATWHQPLGDLLRPEAGDLEGREAMPDAQAINADLVAAAIAEIEAKGVPDVPFVPQPDPMPPIPKSSPTPTIRRR